MTDPYRELGLSPGASQEEVTKAYKKLAKKYHPDLHPNDPAAQEKMSRINEAYDRIRSGKADAHESYEDPFSAYRTYHSSYEQRNDPRYEAVRELLRRGHAYEAWQILARASDRNAEWYYLAAGEITGDIGKIFPEDEAYDGYVQLENGVGMTRLLIDEFRGALENITDELKNIGTDLQSFTNEISFCTGMLFYPVLQALFAEAKALAPGLMVRLYPVRNDFFGEHITVSGLLTGGDIIRALKGKPFGKKLYLPGSVLRAGERVLLDDVTVDTIEKELQTTVAISGHSGYDLVSALFGLGES